MTSSRRNLVREMEAEAKLFWGAAYRLRALLRAGIPPSSPDVVDAVYEIEAIQIHSDWPLMARRCGVVLSAMSVEVVADAS
ncbi:MAG: hypothetical protein ACOVN5_07065 [Aquidulcibacter sp.]